jgi:TPR repeat protein
VRKLLAFLAAMFCFCGTWGADLIKGAAAMERGDSALAEAELTPLAEKGDKDAQVKLGAMYQYGYGVPVDYSRAFDWYQRAAVQGDPEGEVDLGLMYERGLGTSQDTVKALEWFHRSADKNGSAAELQLAIAYERGLGVRPDHGQASAWLAKSLAQHYPPAEAYAGYLAYTGQGEPRNLKRALVLFHTAAYRDDAVGDFYLGKMYFEGDGVTKDYVAAYALSIAARNQRANDPDMTEQPELLERQIAKDMTPSQIADGKKLLDGARQGLINAIDDRRYALTGENFEESDDPLLNPGVPPVSIEIERDGQVHLFGRAIDEASLIQRMQMFFQMSPRPLLNISIAGATSDPSQKQAVDMVLRDVRKIGWHDIAIKRQ